MYFSKKNNFSAGDTLEKFTSIKKNNFSAGDALEKFTSII